MAHWYLPAGGQLDGAARASALGMPLANAGVVAGYSPPSLPCVVCDHDGAITYTAEPTTFSVVWAAHDSAVQQAGGAVTVGTVLSNIADGITAHSAASNPHNITTGMIGAAPVAHSHVDADIPTEIARDTEVTAAIATHAATPHGGATGGVIRKTAAQTLTATAQTAIADASFAVAANSKYFFLMNVNVTTSSGTSPTTAYGFTGPAGSTIAIASEQDTSTSVETNGLLTAFGNLAAGAQVANTGARFTGVVETGVNAGTVQLTAARGGTNPSMVIPIGGVQGFWLKVA